MPLPPWKPFPHGSPSTFFHYQELLFSPFSWLNRSILIVLKFWSPFFTLFRSSFLSLPHFSRASAASQTSCPASLILRGSQQAPRSHPASPFITWPGTQRPRRPSSTPPRSRPWRSCWSPPAPHCWRPARSPSAARRRRTTLKSAKWVASRILPLLWNSVDYYVTANITLSVLASWVALSLLNDRFYSLWLPCSFSSRLFVIWSSSRKNLSSVSRKNSV